MSKDPNEILSSYYTSSNSQTVDDDVMLHRIYETRSSRIHRSVATVSGFAITATAAALMLAWAASPMKQSRNDTASAIARYQMINSGLVQRTNTQERLR